MSRGLGDVYKRQVLRFFSRLADSLLEDSLPGSEGGGSLPPLEERMYAGWSSQRS